MKTILLFPVLILILCLRPETAAAQVEKIITGAGPEDIVTDPAGAEPTLLISCCSRRDSDQEFREIVRYHPSSDSVQVLVRIDEPANITFHPHGIFLDTVFKPERLLVISHENIETVFHPVLIYEVKGDTLFFKEMIDSPLLVSPNCLVTGPGGEIYVVNDAGKHGSLAEMILNMKRGSIVRFERTGEWAFSGERVTSRLGMPAGVNRSGSKLFVADARLNRVFTFDISKDGLSNRQELIKVTGPDNIRFSGDKLLVACHSKPLAFVRHAKSAKNLSPCQIISLDSETGASDILYTNDGSEISAGSVGIELGPYFYIGQVFGDYILKMPFAAQE